MFATLVWDTITKPTQTLRSVALEKKVVPAAGVVLIAWLLQVLSEFALPSEALSSLGGQVATEASPLAGIGNSLVWRMVFLASIPIGWLLISVLFFVVGKVFGSRGSFAGLLAALGFAQSPGLISIAAVSVLRLLGEPGLCLGVLLSLGLGFWVIVLQIIAIRESLTITQGRALATWLLSLAALFVLVMFVSILYAIVSLPVTS